MDKIQNPLTSNQFVFAISKRKYVEFEKQSIYDIKCFPLGIKEIPFSVFLTIENILDIVL